MDNPWNNLPQKPPYVLPEDKSKVLTRNLKARKEHMLHLDLIPEPFVGNPLAPVILLGNNPGVRNADAAAYKRKPAFVERMRANLLHRLADDFPFLYLDPNPDITPSGKRWWERKLKNLLSEFGPDETVARSILSRSILAVEFFPYTSHRFRPLTGPSQQYSFNLVRNAVKCGTVIVLTRGERRWLREIPELEGYPHLVRLKEKQRAPITRGNCRDPRQYEEIVNAIKATLSASRER